MKVNLLEKVSFIDVLDRAHSGPVCKIIDWDTKVILMKSAEKLKEYGLEGTCDSKNPVNIDDSLADKFWNAGFDMAVEVGMLCLDTERVIKFTEEELKVAIKNASSELIIGSGLDRFLWRYRRPEDKYPPMTCFGPFGTAVSEELFIPAIAATAQYKSVDMAMTATPLTIYGRELRGGSPYEILAGKLEAIWMKEAVRRVDRPNMPCIVSGVDSTGWGSIGGWGAPQGLSPKTDFVASLLPSDLKTNFHLLNKIAQLINFNSIGFDSAHYSMIGGYAGGPEASVVSTTACFILQLVVHQAVWCGGLVYDLRFYGGSSRECIWANSVASQAQSRNTDCLTQGAVNPVAGPCSEMVLQETAAQCIGNIASGAAGIVGSRPRGGKYPHYFSGLENGFAAEVSKASAGLKRSDANEIVGVLATKYEDKLKNPPTGKKFEECTDIKTLKPTIEWIEIYKKVCKELRDLGISL
jgi:methylamine--corrinoid protein Co-methyltransferase